MTSIEKSFATARLKTLQQIRGFLQFDLGKLAFTAVNDQIGMGQSPDPLEVARVRSGMESLINHCHAILDALEAGESVYGLVGADHICTYQNITDGDTLAGIHSAAEDMKIMLFTMDMDAIAAPFSTPKNQDTHDADKNQTVSAYRGAKAPDDPYLSYGLSIVYESILQRIEEKIVETTPPPKIIGQDGQPPKPNKQGLLGFVFTKLARQEHCSSRLMRRAAKLPSLWPPLKAGPMSPQPSTTDQPLPEPDQSINSQAAFVDGYIDALRLLYRDLQDIHFKAAAKDKNYAQHLGLGPSWEKEITATAQELFATLRQDIQDRILNKDTRGQGKNYMDGFTAARDWVLYRISTLQIKERYERSPNKEMVAARLRQFWSQQSENIVGDILPGKSSSQAHTRPEGASQKRHVKSPRTYP